MSDSGLSSNLSQLRIDFRLLLGVELLGVSKVHEYRSLIEGVSVRGINLKCGSLIVVCEHVCSGGLIYSVILSNTDNPLVYHCLQFVLVGPRVFSHHSMSFGEQTVLFKRRGYSLLRNVRLDWWSSQLGVHRQTPSFAFIKFFFQ
jgi:hypothetical protein